MKEKDFFKKRIVEMVGKIESTAVLIKIYTVVKTHYEILREKEQED